MRSLLAFGIMVALATPIYGQNASASRHSLGLDVRVVSSGGPVRRTSDASFGGNRTTVAKDSYSKSRDTTSGAGLLVEVRNLSAASDTARVEWYFFGKGVTKNGDDFIASIGSREVTVPPADAQKIEVDSPEFTSFEERNLTLTKTKGGSGRGMSTKKGGARMSGWMVRLLVDGQVAAVRASSPSMEAAGRDPAKLAAYPRKLKKYASPKAPEPAE